MLILPGSVLEQLKKLDLKIVLLVPESAYEKMHEDFAHNGVVVEPIEVLWRTKRLSKKIYRFFVSYLIFEEGARLFAWHGIRLDKPVAGGKRGKFLYPLKSIIASTFGKIKWIKRKFTPWLDNVIHPNRSYKKLFEKYNPDLVFLPDVMSIQDVKVLREAKRQGVKTLGMPGSWDHLPKRFEPLHTDRLMVWSEQFKREAVDLQEYKEEDVSIVGVPQYDIFAESKYILPREKFLTQFGLDPSRKFVSFFSGTRYTPDDGDIADMLVNFLQKKQLTHSTQLFIRPYPATESDHAKFDVFNDTKDVYIDWIEPEKVFPHKGNRWIPTINSLVHLMNIMYHSDVIINTYSSVSVEAGTFLKPIININFDGYKQRPFQQSIKRFKHLSHYKPVVEYGGVLVVNNKDEFLETLNTFLQNPDANKKGVTNLRDKMCWKIDGKASERITKCIIEEL